MTTQPFPWEDVIRFGFGVLRLSSKDFWAMTPREIGAAMNAHFGESGPAPTRQTLEALSHRFPDIQAET